MTGGRITGRWRPGGVDRAAAAPRPAHGGDSLRRPPSQFVIDGHHKLVAAARTATPLTPRSSFAHDHSRVPIDRFRTRHPDEFATTVLPDDRIERLWVEQQIRLLDGADGA